jgi:hypothetical protein
MKVKLSLSMPTRKIRLAEVNLHSILSLTLDGVVNITPRPLYPWEITSVAIE